MKQTFNTLISGLFLVLFLSSSVFSQVDFKTDPRFKVQKVKSGNRQFFYKDLSSIAKHKKGTNGKSILPQSDAGDSTEVHFEWAEKYISPYSDFVYDLKVDAIGNSYVLGLDWTDFSTVIIKYNSSGDSVWTIRNYRGGSSIVLDDFGNLYMAGADSLACIVKYNSSGVEQWVNHYTGLGNEFFTTVKLDPFGNVYVAGIGQDVGYDVILGKYSPIGDSLWIYRYAQPDNFDLFSYPIPLAVDALGNAYATNMKIIDPDLFVAGYLTLKVSTAGIFQWAEFYNSYGNIDFPNAIATDNYGNVFVTGSFLDPKYMSSFGTVKYNSSGVLQWARQHDYSGYGAMDIKADATGNIYITGGSNDSIPGWYEDYVTIKYNTFGDSVWIRRYGGIIPSGDLSWGLALDYYSNVYVTGWTSSLNDLWWEYGTVAYDSGGTQLWVQRYADRDSGNSLATQIEADDNGNVFVSGRRDGDTITYQDFLTVKYNQPHVNPVELSSFTFSLFKRDVELNWATISETNNKGFEIERSDLKDPVSSGWNKIGFVLGNGNTTSPISYSFLDRGLNTGKFKYRLKQIDFNGNFEYFNLSNEISIGVPDKFDLSQNYPNPFNPSTKINYAIPLNGKVNITLFDLSGREVATLVNEVQTAGYYSVTFSAANLSSGIYFYRLHSGNFNETKKMNLIK